MLSTVCVTVVRLCAVELIRLKPLGFSLLGMCARESHPLARSHFPQFKSWGDSQCHTEVTCQAASME